jgi:hypothetical protein
MYLVTSAACLARETGIVRHVVHVAPLGGGTEC